MKTVNADCGVDSVAYETKKRKWYRWHKFPLVPIFDYKPEDEWNTSDFSFSWLNLRIWSMMSWDIGFEVNLSDCGLLLTLRVPYLNIKLWLLIFPDKFHQKFWRVKK